MLTDHYQNLKIKRESQILVFLMASFLGMLGLLIDIILDYLVLGETDLVNYLSNELRSMRFITRRLWFFLFPVIGVLLHYFTVSKNIIIEEKDQQLLQFINTSNDVIILYTNEEISLTNPSFSNLLGYTFNDLDKLNITDFFPQVDRCEKEGGGEFSWITKDGTFLSMDVILSEIHHSDQKLITARHITEERRIQEALEKTQDQLFRSQKMEIAGRFINSIIHDINNFLQVVDNHLDLVELEIEAFDYDLSPVKKALDNTEQLINELMSFSQSSYDVSEEIFEVNEVVRESSTLIEKILKEDIILELNLSEEPLQIKANKSKLSQVLMNLVFNARDAMEDGGKLTITTENQYIPNEISMNHYAILSVADTGNGISEKDKDKIFEPFFTTKENGHGLGLFTVYSIIKQLNGQISLQSEVGRGTTFRVYLPLISSNIFN